MKEIAIDFSKIGTSLFGGKESGHKARELFGIEEYEKKYKEIKFLINVPELPFSITNAFFMGMFKDSIDKTGSKELFLKKYKFVGTDKNAISHIKETLIEEAFTRKEIETFLRDKNASKLYNILRKSDYQNV